MPFLDFLEGLSPWWWVALGFALGAVEMATGTYVLIWFALAAFEMALLHWLMPGLSGEAVVVLYAVLAMGTTFAGRAAMQRLAPAQPPREVLNRRGAELVGRSARVLEFEAGSGVVEVSGMRWRARWPEGMKARAGERVRIVGAEGMELIVQPSTES